jgi:choline kinase
MKAIILAAGIGSRLGKPYPKPLTELTTGETIMQRQISALSKYIGKDNIIIVVGFKKDLIMEEFPDQMYIYNNIYDNTNTSKSLLCALNKIYDEDVLWLNGDVVFDEKVLEPIIDFNGSCMAVNTSSVAEEEVKYNVNQDGSIRQVSKVIIDGLGEAVGINKISQNHLELLKESLQNCEPQDYFERGLELSIEKGLNLFPLDISNHLCIEVDFNEDLESVNNRLSQN